MAQSKTVLIAIYIFITVLVAIFVFGKSGILDSMTQSQEIVKLVNMVNQSQIEMDEMTKEYHTLAKMKKPTTAFLVGQGRKAGNIIVFQQSSSSTLAVKNNDEISQERVLFFIIALIALGILLVGCISIFHLNIKSKINQEEQTDVSL